MPKKQIVAGIKDSGKRRAFKTGAVRDMSTGKGRFDLMPPLALCRLAKHFEGGALKYGVRNWEKGLPMSCYVDSAIRHSFKYLLGMRDEDHLIAAVWNLVCLAQTEMLIELGKLPENLNDLPAALDEKTTNLILSILEPKEKK